MLIWNKCKISFAETFLTILSPITLFFWGGGIVVTTIAGPFGTFSSMSYPQRAAYFLVVVSISIVLGYSVRAFTAALVGAYRPVLFDLVAIGLMTVVFTPIVWAITQSSYFNDPSKVPPLPVFAGYVGLLSAVVFVGRRLIPGFEPGTYGILANNKEDPGQPRMLRRLSPELRSPVLGISANNHTVEIVTCRGTEVLRMRLSDAIEEMEPVEGCCIHRSHWVVVSAVTRIERENSHKMFVVLRNGDRLPVSRNYRSKLEKAGLLKSI